MGKKGKTAAPPPRLPPTKAEYEMMLLQIYKQIGVERAKISRYEKTNDKLRETIQEFEENRSDITLFLNRNLEIRTNSLTEALDECKEIGKLREYDKKELTTLLKDMELKFKNIRARLIGEINILRSKLDSLEEFRAQRDVFMSQLGQQETEFKERDNRVTQELSKLERLNMIEKDRVRKEMEYRIEQLMDDFEKTNEIRVAGYSRQLIRENISLTTTLGKMMVKQSILEVEHKKIVDRYNNLTDKFNVDNNSLLRLQRTCTSQVDIIEDLKHQYLTLKVKHFELLTFKNLYEKKFDENFNFKKKYRLNCKKSEDLAKSSKFINVEKEKLLTSAKAAENQIFQLREKIRILKNIVLDAIETKMKVPDEKLSLREIYNRRQKLLHILAEVLASDEIFEPPQTDISMAVLLSAEDIHKSREEILESFKLSDIISKVVLVKETGNIIPEPIIVPSAVISGVSGTTLILESSEESLPPIEDEGGMGDEDAGASSSESAAGMPETPEEKPVSIIVSEKSAESITVSEFVEEEEYQFEDYENEDEEV